MKNDLIIIGSGPGGYTAAIHAAHQGANVTIIEADRVGGVCLNQGCVPTKVLYQNARVFNTVKAAGNFGVTTTGVSMDFARMQQRKQKIITSLTGGIERLLKAKGIKLLLGRAALADKETVRVVDDNGGVRELKGGHILLATGSHPAMPSIAGIDLPGVCDSEELLAVEELPKSMVVVGGGVIGIELAGIFNTLGCKVRVLETMPTVLPGFDREISQRLTIYLKRKGIQIYTGVSVEEIEQCDDGLLVKAAGGKKELALKADKVLISTGRIPNTSGLNLEKAGVEFGPQGIKVDEWYATSVPGIYAIGDVIGGKMLAHVAAQEGIAAVENMMGRRRRVAYETVPECVFSFPEIAAVGLNEEEATIRGINYITGRCAFAANAQAQAMGKREGVVKVIAHKDTKELLGVHILGPHASDMIHEASLGLVQKVTLDAVGWMVHAHPTLSEAFIEAVRDSEGKAIHQMKGL